MKRKACQKGIGIAHFDVAEDRISFEHTRCAPSGYKTPLNTPKRSSQTRCINQYCPPEDVKPGFPQRTHTPCMQPHSETLKIATEEKLDRNKPADYGVKALPEVHEVKKRYTTQNNVSTNSAVRLPSPPVAQRCI